MAEAVIGTTFVFQVLFLDATNTPIAVISPSIDVFFYDDAGVKQMIVTGAAMTADLSEVGRYVYPQAIDLTFVDGDTLYGTMSGVHPVSSDDAVEEQTVDLVSRDRASGGGFLGLRARFVKGG